ncbi:unnamed protein product, partial [Linum tenue]
MHDVGGNGDARRWRQPRCTTLKATAVDVGDGDDQRRRLEVEKEFVAAEKRVRGLWWLLESRWRRGRR